MTIEYLLRRHVATGDPRPLAVARRSLDAMADGGLRDQLGGGFHRYSTDAHWLVPHFEQMLYDNAQLARVYVHAWSLTGDERYRTVAIGTLDYMVRELTTDDGAFAASQDADTDGIEGLTFTWRATEIRDALDDEAGIFEAAYGVTDEGNWEGVTILSRVIPDGRLAEREGLTEAEIRERLSRDRSRLLERRATRPVRAFQHPRRVAQHEHRLGQLFKLGFPVDVEEARARQPGGDVDRAQVLRIQVVAVELCRGKRSAAAPAERRPGRRSARRPTEGDAASRRSPARAQRASASLRARGGSLVDRHHRIAESTLVDAALLRHLLALAVLDDDASACVEQRPHRRKGPRGPARRRTAGPGDQIELLAPRVELRQRAVDRHPQQLRLEPQRFRVFLRNRCIQIDQQGPLGPRDGPPTPAPRCPQNNRARPDRPSIGQAR